MIQAILIIADCDKFNADDATLIAKHFRDRLNADIEDIKIFVHDENDFPKGIYMKSDKDTKALKHALVYLKGRFDTNTDYNNFTMQVGRAIADWKIAMQFINNPDLVDRNIVSAFDIISKMEWTRANRTIINEQGFNSKHIEIIKRMWNER